MLKVFATQVVVSRGYDGAAAIKFSEKGDAVRFRIGKKLYDPNAENNARWVKINDIKGYADFSDTQIEKITLRKSVTSPEWAVFRDDDLLSQWEAFFKKLELKRGSRPAEADLSLNGGGLRIVIVSTNGKEYSFGIWQTSTECIMELGGKFYITNSSDSPFDETYDEAIARHGMTTPWD